MIMLCAIFVTALAQGKGLPDSYIGLYADRNDKPYVITSGSTMEYVDGDQWGSVAGLYQAPNKDFVANWAQSRNLSTTGRDYWVNFNAGMSSSPWGRAQNEAYKPFKVPLLGVANADNVRYAGEFRMKFLSQSAFTFTMKDSKGIDYASSSLFYLGGYDKIRVGGVYRDKYTDLNITEIWGNGRWTAEGTFTHMSKKYNVQGERLYTRGQLNLIDPTNGRVVGQCVYGYTPSKSQMQAFKKGEFEPTDSLLVNFVTPGVQTVQVKGLSR